MGFVVKKFQRFTLTKSCGPQHFLVEVHCPCCYHDEVIPSFGCERFTEGITMKVFINRGIPHISFSHPTPLPRFSDTLSKYLEHNAIQPLTGFSTILYNNRRNK